MTLVRWSPTRDLLNTPFIDRFFSDLFEPTYDSDRMWRPIVDLAETDESYEIRAEIPGMDKKDIEISFKDNTLVLSGEKKMEKDETKKNYHHIERMYGKFQRSFSMPNDIQADKIEASYNNGILTVIIPKDIEKTKAKAIAIK